MEAGVHRRSKYRRNDRLGECGGASHSTYSVPSGMLSADRDFSILRICRWHVVSVRMRFIT
jgi:hypothetical protein